MRLIFLHYTDNPYSVYGVARPSQLTHLSQTSIQSARAGKLRTKTRVGRQRVSTSSSKPLTVNLSHTTRRALPQRPAIGPQGSNIYSVPTSEHSLYAPAGVYSSIYTTGPQQQPYTTLNRRQTFKQHHLSTDDLTGQYKGLPVVATAGDYYYSEIKDTVYSSAGRTNPKSQKPFPHINRQPNAAAGHYKGRPVMPPADDYYYSEISDTAYSATGLAGSMFRRQLPPIKPQPNAEAQYYSEIEEAAYYKKLLPPPLPDKHPEDHTYHRPTHVSPTIGQPNMDNETEYTGEKEHSKKKKDKKQKKNIKHWSHKAGKAGRKK